MNIEVIDPFDFDPFYQDTSMPRSTVRYYVRGIQVMEVVVGDEETLKAANHRFLARSNVARQLQKTFLTLRTTNERA